MRTLGGVIIAIEGMLLSAAFAASVVASVADNLWLGLLGAVVGALVAGSLAVLSIRYVVNQIVGGTVINILALGLTSYLTGQFLQKNEALNTPGRFQNIAIPGLSDIPFIGPILFDTSIFVYLMVGIVAITYLGLFYTRWGLRVQSVGEHPAAADTVGIRVLFTRYRNVILGGVVAGIEAYFSLGAVGRFEEGMTAGRGFIGLAAMIFGRWNPIGALGAALIFGVRRLAPGEHPACRHPTEFLAMAPYLVTIVIVAGAAHRVRPPPPTASPTSRSDDGEPGPPRRGPRPLPRLRVPSPVLRDDPRRGRRGRGGRPGRGRARASGTSWGTVHGGVIATLADTATGLAFRTVLEPGTTFDHPALGDVPAPGRGGTISAIGRVLKHGRPAPRPM